MEVLIVVDGTTVLSPELSLGETDVVVLNQLSHGSEHCLAQHEIVEIKMAEGNFRMPETDCPGTVDTFRVPRNTVLRLGDHW